jgi:hypothetical protein
VIGVRKASAGPSDDGNLDVLKRINDIASHAVYIGDAILFLYEHAFIDASSEMLGELSVDILVDGALALFGVDYNVCHKKSPELFIFPNDLV